MNLFDRLRGRNAPQAPDATLGSGDVIPADAGFGSRVRAGSGQALHRASEVYRRNPKLVGGLALVAGAMLLNRMKSR